jgi:hypothetical protein
MRLASNSNPDSGVGPIGSSGQASGARRALVRGLASPAVAARNGFALPLRTGAPVEDMR